MSNYVTSPNKPQILSKGSTYLIFFRFWRIKFCLFFWFVFSSYLVLTVSYLKCYASISMSQTWTYLQFNNKALVVQTLSAFHTLFLFWEGAYRSGRVTFWSFSLQVREQETCFFCNEKGSYVFSVDVSIEASLKAANFLWLMMPLWEWTLHL